MKRRGNAHRQIIHARAKSSPGIGHVQSHIRVLSSPVLPSLAYRCKCHLVPSFICVIHARSSSSHVGRPSRSAWERFLSAWRRFEVGLPAAMSARMEGGREDEAIEYGRRRLARSDSCNGGSARRPSIGRTTYR